MAESGHCMTDDTSVLIELWKGQSDEARQMENQRAALTSVVILVTAAGLGFLSQHGHLRTSSVGVTLPMFSVGAFDALACTEYAERWAVPSGPSGSPSTQVSRPEGLRSASGRSSDLPPKVRHQVRCDRTADLHVIHPANVLYLRGR